MCVFVLLRFLVCLKTSLVAQRLKRLPAMWETWVRSLGWEDPLEKEMATHSSILAWRIPWMEELCGLQSTGRKESDMAEWLHFHFHFGVFSSWWLLFFLFLFTSQCYVFGIAGMLQNVTTWIPVDYKSWNKVVRYHKSAKLRTDNI